MRQGDRKTVTAEPCGDWEPCSADPRMQGCGELQGGCLNLLCPRQSEFRSPRACAFALLGLQEYLDSLPGRPGGSEASEALANRLLNSYRCEPLGGLEMV